MTEDPRRGVIIAFLFGGFALVGVSMLANRLDHQPAVQAPAIRILDNDGIAGSPAEIRFVTDAALAETPHGWAAGTMHAHALVDSTMIMPMGSDIRAIAADTFALVVRDLAAGTHIVRMFWADASHRPVGDTARAAFQVR